MSKRKSKRKQQLTFALEVIDPAFAEAMRDAEDIRAWTDGVRPASWRVYRLAKALKEASHGNQNRTEARP